MIILHLDLFIEHHLSPDTPTMPINADTDEIQRLLTLRASSRSNQININRLISFKTLDPNRLNILYAHLTYNPLPFINVLLQVITLDRINQIIAVLTSDKANNLFKKEQQQTFLKNVLSILELIQNNIMKTSCANLFVMPSL